MALSRKCSLGGCESSHWIPLKCPEAVGPAKKNIYKYRLSKEKVRKKRVFCSSSSSSLRHRWRKTGSLHADATSIYIFRRCLKARRWTASSGLVRCQSTPSMSPINQQPCIVGLSSGSVTHSCWRLAAAMTQTQPLMQQNHFSYPYALFIDLSVGLREEKRCSLLFPSWRAKIHKSQKHEYARERCKRKIIPIFSSLLIIREQPVKVSIL